MLLQVSPRLAATRAISPGPPEHTTEHTIAAFCCSCRRFGRRATRHTTNTAQPFQPISIMDSCSHASRVSLLRRRHAATARVLDLLNEAFSTQLQALTLFNFAMAVNVVLLEYSYLPPERRVPVTMAQLSMGLLNVRSPCLAGQRVATAARRPLTLLGRPTSFSGVRNYHKTPPSPSKKGEEEGTRLQMHAAGLFYVNNRTLLSLVAALVTYGVILQEVSPVAYRTLATTTTPSAAE